MFIQLTWFLEKWLEGDTTVAVFLIIHRGDIPCNKYGMGTDGMGKHGQLEEGLDQGK